MVDSLFLIHNIIGMTVQVPTVRTALCDELPEVRMAAARAFDSLHATIGNKALDDILPPMLAALHHPDPAVADATLDGLKQVTHYCNIIFGSQIHFM